MLLEIFTGYGIVNWQLFSLSALYHFTIFWLPFFSVKKSIVRHIVEGNVSFPLGPWFLIVLLRYA